MSRHVQFNETEFPFKTEAQTQTPTKPTASTSMEPPISFIPLSRMGSPGMNLHSTPQVLPSEPLNSFSSSTSEPTAHSQNESTPMTQPHPQSNEPTAPQQNESSPQTQPQTTETQNTTLPTVSNNSTEQEIPNTEPQQNVHKMQTRAKNKISKPIQKLTFTVAGTKSLPKEPTTIKQALQDDKWRGAAVAEFDAHIVNHTWDLEPPQEGQNVIGCRWIFTTNGSEERSKGRLVAKGYTQQYGVDYSETLSPVIKSTTIRLVLEIAVTKAWPIKQLDINNAFLQGDLTDLVYMMQPPGFVDKDKPDHVCRLRKPIYGLK